MNDYNQHSPFFTEMVATDLRATVAVLLLMYSYIVTILLCCHKESFSFTSLNVFVLVCQLWLVFKFELDFGLIGWKNEHISCSQKSHE